ncbi:MAG TPA: DUF1653 domain-containing protein [Candidatus Bathyarchaeia archaeon]|nr:DUF1653 domain-containing protein [Candidatus Bathyarchaeia archaeon]
MKTQTSHNVTPSSPSSIKVGAIYKHYSGKQYKVIAIVHDSEDPSLMRVIYQGLYICPTFGPHPLWARTYTMFAEQVVIDGKIQPRFEEIATQEKYTEQEREVPTFYPAAKIIIRHPSDTNKILLIQRNNYYEPAGGRLEIDFNKKEAENLEECAIREAQEELNLAVTLDEYLGSYSFFWYLDPQKGCSCAVFAASIAYQQNISIKNNDTSEDVMPAWISVHDILQKKIPINPAHRGLENLMIKYCQELLGK